MASFWEEKYLSSQKSIEFLQTQHTQTLQSLHEQIELLQKQCADLSFKLSIQAPTANEKEVYEKQYKTYNNDMKLKDNVIQEQMKSLDEKNKTIKSLQSRICSLEKRLEVDSKFKDDTIKQLKQQVEQQSTQIAQLMFQLHAANKQKSTTQKSSNFTSPRSSISEITEPKIMSKSSLTASSTSSSSPTQLSHEKIDRVYDVNSHSNEKLEVNGVNYKETHSYSNYILPNNNKPSLINIKRQTSATSTDSEKSLTIEKPAKPIRALQLQEVRKRSSTQPVPDPKPFLQAPLSATATGTEHSEAQTLFKHTVKTLPPVKAPPKFTNNKIVVDSPHKPIPNNPMLHNDYQTNEK